MSESVNVLVLRTEMENAEELFRWLADTPPEQQKELLSFLQGVAFGRMLATAPEPDEKKAG